MTPRDPPGVDAPSAVQSPREFPPTSSPAPSLRPTPTASSLSPTSSESSVIEQSPRTPTTSSPSASTTVSTPTDSSTASPSPSTPTLSRSRPASSSPTPSPTSQFSKTVTEPSSPSSPAAGSSSSTPTRTTTAIAENFTTTRIPPFAPMPVETRASVQSPSDIVLEPTPAPSPSATTPAALQPSSERARIAEMSSEQATSVSVASVDSSSGSMESLPIIASITSIAASSPTASVDSPTTTWPLTSTRKSLAALPTSSSSATIISSDNASSSSNSHNLAAKVAPAVIGSLLLLLLLFFGIGALCRRKRQRSLEGKPGYRNSRTSSFGGVEASNSGGIIAAAGRSDMVERNATGIATARGYQEGPFDDEHREKSNWKNGALIGKAVAMLGGSATRSPEARRNRHFSTSSFGGDHDSDDQLAEEDRPRRRDGPPVFGPVAVVVDPRSVAIMMGEQRESEESGSASSVTSSMDRGVGGYNSQSRYYAPARSPTAPAQLPTLSFNAHGSPSSHAIHDSMDSNDPFVGPAFIPIPLTAHRRGSSGNSGQTTGGESEAHSTEGTSSFELHSARRATLGTPTNDEESHYANGEEANNTVKARSKVSSSPKRRKAGSFSSGRKPSISAPFNVNPGRFPENVESDAAVATPKGIGRKLDGSWW